MPGLAWLLNGLYVLLLTVVSPVLLYRSITQGKYRDGWREKLLGELPRLPKTAGDPHRPRLWFHAVSVGEVLQLQRLVAEILSREPAAEVVISTTTSTGLAVAREKFPTHTVCYFPLDFSWAARRAIARIAPDAILLVELELWPNFILAAREAGIPLGLVNGRIGERSFHGYRRIAPLMKRLLACFDLLAMQNWTFASRLERLGAAENRVEVTGSIKFDHVETSRHTPRTTELRTAFQLADGEPVFIAGSTQPPEEQYALDTWLALREEFPRLRLILVPRHQERFEEVARLVLQHGLPLLRRTATLQIGNTLPIGHGVEAASSPDLAGSPPVLLLDTLGELSACWGLADVAFVGGSLTSRGGQNMIEPAGYGAAVLFGPDTRNFRDVVELLLRDAAACVVRNADELTEAVGNDLRCPHLARARGQRAQRLVLAQRGATVRTAELILQRLLPVAGTVPAGTLQSERRAA